MIVTHVIQANFKACVMWLNWTQLV